MNMKFLLLLLTLLPLLAWSASFDCQKAHGATEKMVCADPELSKLDEQLAQTYRGALKTLTSQVKNDNAPPDTPAKLIQEQRHWITYVRDICEDIDCLRKAYQERVQLLTRDPSPFSSIYQSNLIDSSGLDIGYPRDFSNEIKSINQTIIEDIKSNNTEKAGKLIGFNQSIPSKEELGKIIGCNKMIYLPSGGTIPIAYTSAGICTLQKGKKRTLVQICLNETIGEYVIETIDKRDIPYKILADFAEKQCGLGD
jgi:uncharacterized protein